MNMYMHTIYDSFQLLLTIPEISYTIVCIPTYPLNPEITKYSQVRAHAVFSGICLRVEGSYDIQ